MCEFFNGDELMGAPCGEKHLSSVHKLRLQYRLPAYRPVPLQLSVHACIDYKLPLTGQVRAAKYPLASTSIGRK